MKKILSLIILTVLMSSCYKSYITDYPYNSIYFPYPIDVRTVVVGEGMSIQVGVDIGGIRANNIDRNVAFTVDNTLVTPAILASMKNSGFSYVKNAVTNTSTLLPLPSNYFSLSNLNTMVIKAGQHMGYITLTVDSARFLADPLTLSVNYAVPFSITSANTDSILPAMRTAVIGLKYESMLFGNYWHGGVTTIKDAAGNIVKTNVYPTAIPTAENKIWKLTTVAPFSLITNGYSDQTTTKAGGEMQITLNGTNVIVSSAAGATNVIQPDGPSTYNNAKLLQNRKIFLNYKYANADGTTSYVKDTLTFRNRIRDGVNEWQDENPSHY
ncbi:MAG: DUF1735 domain-containing protein [Bacteroidota bacterium]|nr:DUF1735 domain-containing protein [Bacteroidota bacterium]